MENGLSIFWTKSQMSIVSKKKNPQNWSWWQTCQFLFMSRKNSREFQLNWKPRKIKNRLFVIAPFHFILKINIFNFKKFLSCLFLFFSAERIINETPPKKQFCWENYSANRKFYTGKPFTSNIYTDWRSPKKQAYVERKVYCSFVSFPIIYI